MRWWRKWAAFGAALLGMTVAGTAVADRWC